jgi:hypothetical protein
LLPYSLNRHCCILLGSTFPKCMILAIGSMD